MYGSDSTDVIIFPIDSVLDIQKDFKEEVESQKIPCCVIHRIYANVLVTVPTTICIPEPYAVTIGDGFKFEKRLFKARIPDIRIDLLWRCFKTYVVVLATIDCKICMNTHNCTVSYVLNGQAFSYNYNPFLLPEIPPIYTNSDYPLPCGNCPDHPDCPSGESPNLPELKDIVLSK